MISREGIAESRALIADGVEIEVAQERRWSVKQRGRGGISRQSQISMESQVAHPVLECKRLRGGQQPS